MPATEVIFAVAILVGWWFVCAFFVAAGYLPTPFFDQSFDTFMDWYNTAYWSYRPGPYSDWYTIYPPLSFVLLRVFSRSQCYGDSSIVGRECDPIGMVFISLVTILNAVLLAISFKKSDSRTYLPRSLALGLGLPALYAWERGNVLVPCFTCVILGYGRSLKSGFLKSVFIGLSVNFKPYLLLILIGKFISRRWRKLEGAVLATIIIYLISYTVYGKGDLIALYQNASVFSGPPNEISLDAIEYSTTYSSIMRIFESQLPLMHFVGSKNLALAAVLAPLLMRVGAIGVLACFVGAMFRPKAITSGRLAALAMSLFLTISTTAGGYAELFLLFFVFGERVRGIGAAVALVAAYALCVPWDMTIVRMIYAVTNSYLSNRAVGYEFGVTLGSIVRPGLVLMIEYGLVAASVVDLMRDVYGRTEISDANGLVAA